jgi:formylglycine-generating enzyme required for sulfatase activity
MYLSLFKSVLFAAALTAASLLSAQVPQLLNYQGRVAVGAPAVYFEGTGAFKFALVDADGFTSYWSNDGTSYAGSEPSAAVDLLVAKGVYSVLLGDELLMQPIPHSVFANSDVHLRVWFDDGVNGSQLITPDRRIAAVGYAMVASEALTVADGAIASAQLADNLTLGGTTSGTFSGDGAGLTNIPASAIVEATEPAPAGTEGMVLIPAGPFMLGESSDPISASSDNVPAAVQISAFYMDATEVTLAEWQIVQQWAVSNGYTDLPTGSAGGQEHPVEGVNWYDCVKWCNARSEKAGLSPVYYTDDAQQLVYRTGSVDVTHAQVNWDANGYRLPTEAEWEKAARGGLSGQRFPWGNAISLQMANYTLDYYLFYDVGLDNSSETPSSTPVGSFDPNGYGLHDMAGNVSEWCSDLYFAGTYANGASYANEVDPLGADPQFHQSEVVRVLRGGSWNAAADVARCAARSSASPDLIETGSEMGVGFRTVLVPIE